MEKVRVGVSRCLLGEKVRYDGKQKQAFCLTDSMGPFIEWLSVCPEVECGLTVPREAMRLVGDRFAPRLSLVRTGEDRTDRMGRWIQAELQILHDARPCGFIFKSKSPSCGIRDVPLYATSGARCSKGPGLFAGAFMGHFPFTPVEDERRLRNPAQRENFIIRVFVFKNWQEHVARDRTLKGLIEFHATHKLLVLSHSPRHAGALGRLLASSDGPSGENIHEAYMALLMGALRHISTVAKHTNVLLHGAGYLKKLLSGYEKETLLGAIEEFRMGFSPLIVPITLINHYAAKYDDPYLSNQVYLHPSPARLMLMNHA
jgi:uncharacterized protein YbgA (DUF1722 family)/uncharacterized protein YbbK (DUF523 family)